MPKLDFFDSLVRRGLAIPVPLPAPCPYRTLLWPQPSPLLVGQLCHLGAAPAPRHAHHCPPGEIAATAPRTHYPATRPGTWPHRSDSNTSAPYTTRLCSLSTPGGRQ